MTEKEDPKGWIDMGLQKLTSRKLLVFMMTTLFFTMEMIDSEQWLAIAVGYLGSQGFVDIVSQWRGRS